MKERETKETKAANNTKDKKISMEMFEYTLENKPLEEDPSTLDGSRESVSFDEFSATKGKTLFLSRALSTWFPRKSNLNIENEELKKSIM